MRTHPSAEHPAHAAGRKDFSWDYKHSHYIPIRPVAWSLPLNYLLRLRHCHQRGQRAGAGCLNSFSASISGASAGVRLPSGEAAA